jgi:CHASE1-domain containing sensor protein
LTFVQDLLPIVVVAVVLLAGVVAVALAFSARGTYDQIGRSDITFDREAPRSTNDLHAEVRAFVEARNARRIARGEPPLDVEAEVERRLARQDG